MLKIAAISGVLCAFAIWRHTSGRGWHGFAMPILGLVAIGTGWFGWQSQQFEDRLTSATRELTGLDDISVVCQGFAREFRLDNHAGEAYIAEGRAELRGNVCDDLREWINSDKHTPSREQIFALHVLSHEAIHLVGVRHEATTDCYALQYNDRLAELLGATPTQAAAVAQRVYDEIYAHTRGEYRSPNCRPDDKLDLTPGDGLFPGDAGDVVQLPVDATPAARA